jgi:hypothetical protein
LNLPIKSSEILSFLKGNVEPLDAPFYGKRYRSSVKLTDGVLLPCVVFQQREDRVQLALKRFKEAKGDQYLDVVRAFVSKGANVSEWQIASVDVSPWAFPVALLKTIHGETAMGWTSFVVEMQDGSMHSFGTTFSFEFFELPEGYKHQDIKRIHSGMVYSDKNGLTSYSLATLNDAVVYRERPYFTCYLDQFP